MTLDEFIAARKHLGMSQTQLANHLGMSLRGIQDIEGGKTGFRFIHSLAMERIILACVAAGDDPSIMPEELVKDVRQAAGR